MAQIVARDDPRDLPGGMPARYSGGFDGMPIAPRSIASERACRPEARPARTFAPRGLRFIIRQYLHSDCPENRVDVDPA
jgi:hypothetical protein